MKKIEKNNQEIQTQSTDLYAAPSIEVIEVKVERGFEGSMDPEGTGGKDPSW